jgi:hypothetical protein
MQVPFTSHAFKHPRATHSALDVLGYRRNGAPIYTIAGGNGEGEGASGSGGQAGAGESGASGQGESGTAAQGSGQGGQQSGKESGTSGSGTGEAVDWEAKYKETLGHSREWEKRAKENKSAAEKGTEAAAELEKIRQQNMSEQEKAVAEAEKAGRTAAAQEAQAEIDKRDARLRELTLKDAVRDRADKHSVKPAALLNSLSFRERIADLDPADKTFGANLDDAIKAELKDHPEFGVQSAGKSGGDLSGGTGEGSAKQRPTSLSAAVRGTFNT